MVMKMQKQNFSTLAKELGKDKAMASAAYDYAAEIQKEMLSEFKLIGQEGH